MTKEEFKQMFQECFYLRAELLYDYSGVSLEISLVDVDTNKKVDSDWVSMDEFSKG